jgi:phospholipid/cholesterol/gamma-HCH transport system permease protein
MLTLLAAIGAVFLAFLAQAARSVAGADLASLTPPFHLRMLFNEMVNIGYFSLPVVGLTAVFTGMVLALNHIPGSVGRCRGSGGDGCRALDCRELVRWSPD